MAEDEDNNRSDYAHTEVSGAINQHTPSYWRLALPALGVRYGATFLKDWSKQTTNKYYDAAAGAWMLLITTLFTYRTYNDMKSIFSEAVAYETDKHPSQIGVKDLLASSNKCVEKARNNLLRYTGLRGLVNASFFTSFSSFKPHPDWKPLNETSAINLGMGANSAYLTYEVLGRDRTFFEQLQSFIDSKLNQRNAMGEDIKPIDLLHLFERNAIDNDPQNAYRGRVDSMLWKQSQVIFERMAELMNSTYQHRTNGEKANFTLPKFIYMLGNNLLQPKKVEQTLAYIEIANRYGVPALKEAVKSMRDGTDLSAVLQRYPITLPGHEAPEQAAAKFSKTLAAAPSSYADKVTQSAAQSAVPGLAL